MLFKCAHHAPETGALEKRIQVPHFRQRFNPRPRTRFAASSNERCRNSRTSVGGVNHDPAEPHELMIEHARSKSRRFATETEEAVPWRK